MGIVARGFLDSCAAQLSQLEIDFLTKTDYVRHHNLCYAGKPVIDLARHLGRTRLDG